MSCDVIFTYIMHQFMPYNEWFQRKWSQWFPVSNENAYLYVPWLTQVICIGTCFWRREGYFDQHVSHNSFDMLNKFTASNFHRGKVIVITMCRKTLKDTLKFALYFEEIFHFFNVPITENNADNLSLHSDIYIVDLLAFLQHHY